MAERREGGRRVGGREGGSEEGGRERGGREGGRRVGGREGGGWEGGRREGGRREGGRREGGRREGGRREGGGREEEGWREEFFPKHRIFHTGLPGLQIKSETFLEDINNVLNSGDVPNIYPPEDMDKICHEMKPIVQDAGLQPTKANLFSAYTKRVRSNIHMVLCMRYETLCVFGMHAMCRCAL